MKSYNFKNIISYIDLVKMIIFMNQNKSNILL